MEDNFRVRVDKIFGSLGGGAAPTEGSGASLWSLTDEEIERRKWNRASEQEADDDDDDDKSGLSVLPDPLDSDLQYLSDGDEEGDDEEEEEEEEIGGEDKGVNDVKSIVDDEWDVKANIGRDCTLDYEEEEDEFDKVAVGSKRTGDFVYMRDVKTAYADDYGIEELDTSSELPITFKSVARDPRANHAAARCRLKEDAEASDNFDTLQLSDTSVTTNTETNHFKEKNGDNPKPILKKGETLVDSRSQKRVRFLCEPESSSQNVEQPVSQVGDLALSNNVANDDQVSDRSQYPSDLPDYLRNPSKYTRYTFEPAEDVDDRSNQKALMDFFQYIRKRDTDSASAEETCDVPKSVTFNPKVKDNSIVKMTESKHNAEDDLKNKGLPIGVTAVDAQESEVSAMEEDEPCVAVDTDRSLQKPGRQYRARTNIDVEENLT